MWTKVTLPSGSYCGYVSMVTVWIQFAVLLAFFHTTQANGESHEKQQFHLPSIEVQLPWTTREQDRLIGAMKEHKWNPVEQGQNMAASNIYPNDESSKSEQKRNSSHPQDHKKFGIPDDKIYKVGNTSKFRGYKASGIKLIWNFYGKNHASNDRYPEMNHLSSSQKPNDLDTSNSEHGSQLDDVPEKLLNYDTNNKDLHSEELFEQASNQINTDIPKFLPLVSDHGKNNNPAKPDNDNYNARSIWAQIKDQNIDEPFNRNTRPPVLDDITNNWKNQEPINANTEPDVKPPNSSQIWRTNPNENFTMQNDGKGLNTNPFHEDTANISNKDILLRDRFPAQFFTRPEIQVMNLREQNLRHKRDLDGDICCKTDVWFGSASTKLTDIDDTGPWNVVTGEDVFQAYARGDCHDSNPQTSCPGGGTCTQKKRLHILWTEDGDSAKIRYFHINSHCSYEQV